MTERDVDETLTPENASLAWDLLSEQVEALVQEWESAGEPPELQQFLPPGPSALRRLALIELVKVDLEYRWKTDEWRQPLEHYLGSFPELADGGHVPSDLIYEEFHIRRQAGDEVEPQEYFSRFPGQTQELEQLLGTEAPHLTTLLVSGQASESFSVGQKVDDFDLLVQLGKGAFGTVYLARQISMQRLVALKVTADRGNEPQTLAQLDHPHIVRVYDVRQIAERRLRLLYMQYIAGGTLQQVTEQIRKTPPALRRGSVLLEVIDRELSNRGESPPADSRLRQHLAEASWPEAVCWIGSRLAAALEYAHQRGVLHRDVKPANVLLAADGTPKLADFNISFNSKVEGASAAAYFGGSLAYMSPEQLEACNPAHPRQAEELDGRSDVYSLAVMLWELLTGARPFPDEQMTDGWQRALEQMIARRQGGVGAAAQAQIPHDCPDALSQVLLTALAPEAANRFHSAGAFSRQLDLCLKPQVQQLLRPRARSWLTRSRRLPLLAMIAAVILPNLVLTGLNIWHNVAYIVREMLEPVVPQAVPIFWYAVAVVNSVLYPLGVGLILWIVWRVLTAVRARQLGESVSSDVLAAARRRALVIGDAVAWICFALWVASGIIFPILLHAQMTFRLGPAMENLDFELYYLYRRWVVVQFLAGLIAGTLCFFLVTFLAVRSFYPILIQSDTADHAALGQLRRLRSRVVIVFGATVVAPIISLAAAGITQQKNNNVYWGLLLVSMATIGLCGWLFSKIFADTEALAQTVSPGTHRLGDTVESTGSFWTGSG